MTNLDDIQIKLAWLAGYDAERHGVIITIIAPDGTRQEVGILDNLLEHFPQPSVLIDNIERRILALEGENALLKAKRDHYVDETLAVAHEQQQRIEALEAALRHYANEDDYRYGADAAILWDGGEVARRALGED